MKGCTSRVGKVMCSVSVQGVFEEDSHHPLPRQLNGDREYSLSLPGFRFKRLSRAVHWQRIKGLNIDRVLQNHDTRTLLACLDDVVSGDASQEDIDPKLHKALQLQQYSAQYLLSCHSLLRDKERVVRTALRTFEDEERLLDLKIAKMRAREKALERESRECDRMCSDYTALLRDLSPRLVDDLYRSYRSKVRRQRQDDDEDINEREGERERERDTRGAQVLAISGRRQAAQTERGGTSAREDRGDDEWGRTEGVDERNPKRGGNAWSSHEQQNQHQQSFGGTPVARHENTEENQPPLRGGAQFDAVPHLEEEDEEEEEQEVGSGGFKSVRRVTAISSTVHSTASGNLNSNLGTATQELAPPRTSTEPPIISSTSHQTYQPNGNSASAIMHQSTASAAMSVDSLAPREEMRAVQSKVIAVPMRVPVVLLRSASARDSSGSSDSESAEDRDAKRSTKPSNQLSQTFPSRHQTSHSYINLTRSSDSDGEEKEEEEDIDPRRLYEESYTDQSLSFLDLDAHPKAGLSSAAQQTQSVDAKSSKSARKEEQEDPQDKYDYKRHSPPQQKEPPLRAKASSPAPAKISAAPHTSDDKHSLSGEVGTDEQEEEDQYDDDPFSPYPQQERGDRSPPTYDSRLGGSSAFSPQPNYAHQQRHLDMSADIDASSSVVIDFAFPTAGTAASNNEARAKEQLGIRTGVVNYLHRSTHGERDQSNPWDEDSSSQPGSMGTLQLARQGDENSPFGDSVLLGTAKRSAPFNISRRLMGDTDTLNGSDGFDRDSLAGTAPLRPRPSEEPLQQRLSDSPWGGTGSIPEEEEEEEVEESNIFADLGSVNSVQQMAALATPQWVMGRADMESIELAQAFDVFVSALRLDDLQGETDCEQAVVSLCFLGIESAHSSRVALRGSSAIQPLSFSAHMRFNESTAELLRTEISEFEDLLAFQINVTALGADGQTTVMLAQAHINLWVMVEDACNILRQEVDIMSAGDNEMDMQVVGSAVVDVRGYRLLQKYST